jgi:hypothetical protein
LETHLHEQILISQGELQRQASKLNDEFKLLTVEANEKHKSEVAILQQQSENQLSKVERKNNEQLGNLQQ